MILEFLGLVAAALVVASGGLFVFFKYQYTYWSKKKIAHSSPAVPLGDIRTDRNLSTLFHDFYDQSADEKVYGVWLLHKPVLLVNDLDLSRKILVQDFQHFHGRGSYINEKDDPLSNHLFSQEGAKWKGLRAKLSPTFTSGKMKNMFHIVAGITQTMQKVVQPLAEKGGIINSKGLFARYTTDVISSCAFGFDANSLENPESIFRKMGMKLFEPTRENTVRNGLAFFVPEVAQLFRLVQFNKELTTFFKNTVYQTIEQREKENEKRNDFMQLLVQLKNKGFIDDVNNKDADGKTFTSEDAAAQCFLFFIAGYETSATTLLFLFYHLARNPDVQERLREEILNDMKQNDGKMTYDGIFKLQYMGKVISEILRMYPPAPALIRQAANDYKVPDMDFTIDKGTMLFVNIIGIQHDPKYWTNPKVFDPERFNEEEVAKRPKYSYMPFGEGPRFCIGQRFAYMQIRSGIYAFLSKYRVEMCAETPDPLVINPKAFNLSPEGEVPLKVTPI